MSSSASFGAGHAQARDRSRFATDGLAVEERYDLVVVGEWMPITVFRNAGGGRLVRLVVPGLEKSNGWWNRIVAGDFTGDGRVDFIVGNLGENGGLHASSAEPTTMIVNLRLLAGLTSFISNLCRSHFCAIGPAGMRASSLTTAPR